MGTQDGDCYRCGEPGHWDRNCPLQLRAYDFEEHMARLHRLVDRWTSGEITQEVKRIGIGQENRLWYGDQCPARLTYP
jgi:hypothetical protein